MRVVRTEVRVYEFGELSEEAKERAKDDHRACMGFSSHEDYVRSFKALVMTMGGGTVEPSIDWFDTSCYRSDSGVNSVDDMPISEFLRVNDRLGSVNPKTGKGLGDCKLTGYCADEDALDGFRAAVLQWHKKNPQTLISGLEPDELDEDQVSGEDIKVMLEAAFVSLVEAGLADCEYQYGDEAFGETCEANEWEFLEDGEMYVAPKGVESVVHPVGPVGIA